MDSYLASRTTTTHPDGTVEVKETFEPVPVVKVEPRIVYQPSPIVNPSFPSVNPIGPNVTPKVSPYHITCVTRPTTPSV